MKAEAQALPPRRAGIGWLDRAAMRFRSAAGEVARFPGAELECACDHHDHTANGWHGLRPHRAPHLDPCQRGAEREDGRPDHGPDEEVARAQKSQQRDATKWPVCSDGDLIAPQRREKRRQQDSVRFAACPASLLFQATQ